MGTETKRVSGALIFSADRYPHVTLVIEYISFALIESVQQLLVSISVCFFRKFHLDFIDLLERECVTVMSSLKPLFFFLIDSSRFTHKHCIK